MVEPKRLAEAAKSPVVWLAVYEAARKRGDTALAERARRELQQAGVTVGEAQPCK